MVDVRKLPNHEIPTTAYAFNCLFMPRFVQDINKRFKHVESDMSGKSNCDSHGVSYNLLESTMYVNQDQPMDVGLTRVFLETVQARTENYNQFLSWGHVPHVEFKDEYINGQVFKRYTLRSSFSVK